MDNKLLIIARNYKEMGEINLLISNEFFHLEGEVMYEMDKKNGRGKG